MQGLSDFWVHTVTVKPYQGISGNGDTIYGAPVTVPGFLDGSRRLVRDGNGTQVISQSTFYCDTTYQADFVPGSQVTLPDRATPTVVLTLNVNDSGDLALPDHVAVFLQ